MNIVIAVGHIALNMQHPTIHTLEHHSSIGLKKYEFCPVSDWGGGGGVKVILLLSHGHLFSFILNARKIHEFMSVMIS